MVSWAWLSHDSTVCARHETILVPSVVLSDAWLHAVPA